MIKIMDMEDVHGRKTDITMMVAAMVTRISEDIPSKLNMATVIRKTMVQR